MLDSCAAAANSSLQRKEASQRRGGAQQVDSDVSSNILDTPKCRRVCDVSGGEDCRPNLGPRLVQPDMLHSESGLDVRLLWV